MSEDATFQLCHKHLVTELRWHATTITGGKHCVIKQSTLYFDMSLQIDNQEYSKLVNLFFFLSIIILSQMDTVRHYKG
jgi:hypothetical protein